MEHKIDQKYSRLLLEGIPIRSQTRILFFFFWHYFLYILIVAISLKINFTRINNVPEYAPRKIPHFHLISWYWNFVERHSFRIVSNRPKLCGNCAFPQIFHTRKLGENTVFYAVMYSILEHISYLNKYFIYLNIVIKSMPKQPLQINFCSLKFHVNLMEIDTSWSSPKIRRFSVLVVPLMISSQICVFLI